MGELQTAITIALAEIQQRKLKVRKASDDLSKLAAKILDGEDAPKPVIPAEWDSILRNATDAFAAQDQDRVTLRDRRTLIYNFQSLEPKLVMWLCENERAAKLFANQILSKWQPQSPESLSPYTNEFFNHPNSHYLAAPFRTPRFATAGFPSILAKSALDIPTVGVIGRLFERLSPLRPSRTLGQCVIGHLALLRAADKSAFDQFIEMIVHDHSYLLDFKGDTEKTANDHAKCLVVAAVLQRIHLAKDYHNPAYRDFLDGLRFTGLGDPRRVTLSLEWKLIKSFAPEAFSAYVGLLNEQDIRFFFNSEEVDMHEQRKNFWENYIGAMERTIVILDRDVHTRMKARVATQNEESQRALEMARVFKVRSQFNALIMIFPTAVAIEFNKSGAASFVVTREIFENIIMSEIKEGAGGTPTNLNGYLDIRTRILKAYGRSFDSSQKWYHTGPWPRKFRERLQQGFGLVQTPKQDPHHY